MAKFDREAMKKSRLATTSLKSTGQSKYALEEEVNEYLYTAVLSKQFSAHFGYIRFYNYRRK